MASDEPMVGIVGDGPAVEAIEAAVGDTGAGSRRSDVEAAGESDLACVVDRAGDQAFSRVNADRSAPWIAVELGGLGGFALPELDAGVAVLGGGPGCYRCLRSRVAANQEGEVGDDPTTTRRDARLAGAVAGRLAAELLDGADRSGRVVALPYAEHELLPVPTCGCASRPEREMRLTDEAVGLDAAADRAERTIDGRLGLINTIGEAESFPAPYYLARLADTSAISDVKAGPQAAGVAVDWNRAFMKAAGEALERYAAGVYRRGTFETAVPAELDDAVPPESFVRPDGYPTPDEPIEWVPGQGLQSGDPVWLPAEFAVFPPPAERFKPAITTGLGLGTSGVDAVRSGLYEVIERDATMLAWYSTFDPLGLEIDDEGFATLARRARAEDLTVTVLLVTQDVDVPVVTVAVHREGDWPRFAVGSGADLDPAAAARSALAEALQNWMELRGMGKEGADEEDTAIGRYSRFPTEVRDLVEPVGSVAAAEIAPGEFDSRRAELDAVVDRLDDAGLRAYATRLTTVDLETVGFEAVRVLSPSAQPLFIDERCFGDRARQIPRDLGYRPRFDRPPHPYP